MDLRFNLEDISQIIVGAFALSAPIAFSEEAWRIAASLPTGNLILVVLLTLVFLGFYAYQGIFQHDITTRAAAFAFRIVIAYLITLAVVALVLLALDKLPLAADPLLAFKRVILIAMPASIGAIVVDSLDKE